MPTEYPAAAKRGMFYVRRIPKDVPDGLVLVHNVMPRSPRQQPSGLHGFRAYLSERTDKHVLCDCGWAPELPEHYRPTTDDDPLSPERLEALAASLRKSQDSADSWDLVETAAAYARTNIAEGHGPLWVALYSMAAGLEHLLPKWVAALRDDEPHGELADLILKELGDTALEVAIDHHREEDSSISPETQARARAIASIVMGEERVAEAIAHVEDWHRTN